MPWAEAGGITCSEALAGMNARFSLEMNDLLKAFGNISRSRAHVQMQGKRGFSTPKLVVRTTNESLHRKDHIATQYVAG